jgi:ribosomal protein L24
VSAVGDIKIGDRVRVVRGNREDLSFADGSTGVVDRVDAHDAELPYRVVVDGGTNLWVHSVEPLSPTPPTDREIYVTRAQELLSGTTHNGADVIALARFLAGEDE